MRPPAIDVRPLRPFSDHLQKYAFHMNFGFLIWLRETLSTIASILWRGWLVLMLCPLSFRGQSTLGPDMRYIQPVLVLCVFTKKPHPPIGETSCWQYMSRERTHSFAAEPTILLALVIHFTRQSLFCALSGTLTWKVPSIQGDLPS